MTQIQKYTWLIETIRHAGKISYRDLSDLWERNKDLSDFKPLHRATFRICTNYMKITDNARRCGESECFTTRTGL